MPSLPRDSFGNPIPVLERVSPFALDFDGTSDRVALTFPTENLSTGGKNVVRIVATQNCFFLFGDSSVTVSSATGHFLPAGAVVDEAVPEGATHVAVIQVSSAGSFYLSTMK